MKPNTIRVPVKVQADMPGARVAAWIGAVAVIGVLAAIAFASLALAAMSFHWLAGQF